MQYTIKLRPVWGVEPVIIQGMLYYKTGHSSCVYHSKDSYPAILLWGGCSSQVSTIQMREGKKEVMCVLLIITNKKEASLSATALTQVSSHHTSLCFL